jgi:Carbon-nitrogen hydrolase
MFSCAVSVFLPRDSASACGLRLRNELSIPVLVPHFRHGKARSTNCSTPTITSPGTPRDPVQSPCTMRRCLLRPPLYTRQSHCLLARASHTFGPSFLAAIRKMSSSSEVPSPVLKKPLTIALIQLASGADKSKNLAHAAKKVKEAAGTGAKLVVLPECFNSPYGASSPTHAQPS